jgi:hypothetical protein
MSKPRHILRIAGPLCGVAAVALLSGCVSALTSTSARRETVVVKVSLHSWHDLAIELDNATSNRVDLCEATLPWRWRYAMWVKAFEDDATGSPIEEALKVADMPVTHRRASLMPGIPMAGNIDLRDRFPQIEDVLKRHDVIIFWSYVLKLGNGNIASRLSGSLTVPRFR